MKQFKYKLKIRSVLLNSPIIEYSDNLLDIATKYISYETKFKNDFISYFYEFKNGNYAGDFDILRKILTKIKQKMKDWRK